MSVCVGVLCVVCVREREKFVENRNCSFETECEVHSSVSASDVDQKKKRKSFLDDKTKKANF